MNKLLKDVADFYDSFESVLDLSSFHTEDPQFEVMKKVAGAIQSELPHLISEDGLFASANAKKALVQALEGASEACHRLGYGVLAETGQRLANEANKTGVIKEANKAGAVNAA